jgi:hypothetical protein
MRQLTRLPSGWQASYQRCVHLKYIKSQLCPIAAICVVAHQLSLTTGKPACLERARMLP